MGAGQVIAIDPVKARRDLALTRYRASSLYDSRQSEGETVTNLTRIR